MGQIFLIGNRSVCDAKSVKKNIGFSFPPVISKNAGKIRLHIGILTSARRISMPIEKKILKKKPPLLKKS